MNHSVVVLRVKCLLLSCSVFFSIDLVAQNLAKKSSPFLEKVRFGGGIGLQFASGATNIMLAPSAVYDFNRYVSAGVGLQGSYVNVKNNYTSLIYGISLIGLANPLDNIQLSVDIEQLKVNTTYNATYQLPSAHFWNTSLFVGAGYRSDNMVIGLKYNILYDKNKSIYSDPLLPFVRFYF